MMTTGICPAKQRRMTRHKHKYEAYRNSEQREVNKAKKLVKHLTRHPASADAFEALAGLGSGVRRKAGAGEFYDQMRRA